VHKVGQKKRKKEKKAGMLIHRGENGRLKKRDDFQSTERGRSHENKVVS